MTEPRAALVERIRSALPSGRSVREVAMFGGTAFMLDDRMLVSVGKDGTLLVRVDPDQYEDLLQHRGARPSFMGKDRPMGPSWLTVDGDGLRTGADLARWVATALDFHAAADQKD
ncbi:MAG: TfoX/Sxy family protein [Propionibacteriaceae bacterium]